MKQYLDLMRHVRENGVYKSDRTGTGTYSVFGHQMRFDLSNGQFPLVTTKKCHLKSIIHELLWFLQGDTNIRYLKENGVSIWDDWVKEGTAEYRTLTDDEIVKAISTHHGRPAKFWQYVSVSREGRSHFEYQMYTDTPADGVGIPCTPGTTLEDLYEETFHCKPLKLIAGELGPVYGAQWRSWPDIRESTKGVNLTIAERCEEANQYGDYYLRMGKAYAQPAGEERRMALKALSNELDAMGIPKERRVPSVSTGSIDQIANIVKALRTNPDSRRIIVSAWNPALVDEMALPPCHAMFQFYSAPLSIDERWELLKGQGGSAEKTYREYLEECTEMDDVRGPGIKEKDYNPLVLSDDHIFLSILGVPSRKLSCQLYQR